MIDKNKIEFYRTKILDDKLFVASGRSGMLLDYLIKKAIEGQQLKEYTIGSELFKENYKADHNDGIVRVHIYNLRKRLQQYYHGTGADDAVQFLLAKGDYNIQFINREGDVKRPHVRRNIAIAVATVVVILAIATYFITKPRYYCWESFLGGKGATTCIVADKIVMRKIVDGVTISLTHPDIVTQKDFRKYTKENASENLTLSNYTTYTKAIPHSVQRLTQWFTQHDRSFNIVNESDFSIQDTRTANLIYIGQFKVMNLSRELFLKKSKRFGIEGLDFYSINDDGERIVHRTKFAIGQLGFEHAMVSYVPMDGGYDAIYLTSNNDIGTMGVVAKFTDPKFLKEFYRQLPSEKSYFNALFKIEGMNRTNLSCELVELEILDL